MDMMVKKPSSLTLWKQSALSAVIWNKQPTDAGL